MLDVGVKSNLQSLRRINKKKLTLHGSVRLKKIKMILYACGFI
jgi:hypothetical protein